ncbi:5-deoxy-glucuronate isomerase [Kribbella sp. NPDC050820]|uniref:5-deoxy-glucuronate isomerase n=1 Tax=Kribbella sp. NPDC050820 TaxID=3155408 RepID=UPI0033D2EFCC
MTTAYFEAVSTSPGMNDLKGNTCSLLNFALVILETGQSHRFLTADREYAIVVLTGTVDIAVGDGDFKAVGGRTNVLAGKPSMVYAPAQTEVTVTATQAAEVSLCSAPSTTTTIEPYLVGPDEATSGTWGTFNTTRDYNFLIDDQPASERLYVAEVTVESGNWATYLPHRHEIDDPGTGEAFQEEMYFYRVAPSSGFGFAGLYGDRVGGDNAFIVRHNTIHKMPAGYHTVVAAPGYRTWYLALFAGGNKSRGPLTDPEHAWYHHVETALRTLQRSHHD